MGGWGVGAGSAGARSPGGARRSPAQPGLPPSESPGLARGRPGRAGGDLRTAERRPLPSAAWGAPGAQVPRPPPPPPSPRVLCGPRGSHPDRRPLPAPPPSAGCRPSPPPARESPHWSRCRRRRGCRDAAASVSRTLLPGKVAPRGAAWSQVASELRVTIFFFLPLSACLCAVVLTPPPSAPA